MTDAARDQLAIWLAVHVAGAVRMDAVELADQILAGPLSAVVDAAKLHHADGWGDGCSVCRDSWPCRTVQALDGTS